MIAYEILVQTIADWKAGVRPTTPVPPQAAAPEVVEEYESGVVDIDDGYGEQQYEEQGYEEQSEAAYEQPYDEQAYADDEQE